MSLALAPKRHTLSSILLQQTCNHCVYSRLLEKLGDAGIKFLFVRSITTVQNARHLYKIFSLYPNNNWWSPYAFIDVLCTPFQDGFFSTPKDKAHGALYASISPHKQLPVFHVRPWAKHFKNSVSGRHQGWCTVIIFMLQYVLTILLNTSSGSVKSLITFCLFKYRI